MMTQSKLTLGLKERKRLLTTVDLMLVSGALTLSLWLDTLSHAQGPSLDLFAPYWPWLLLILLWPLLAHAADLYDPKASINLSRSALGLLEATTLSLIPSLILPPLFSAGSLFHSVALLFILFYFPLFSWRSLYVGLSRLALFQRKALIVGANQSGRTIARTIQGQVPSVYHLVGYVDDDPTKQGRVIEGLPVIGGSEELPSLIRERAISALILAASPAQSLPESEGESVEIVVVSDLYEEISGRVLLEKDDSHLSEHSVNRKRSIWSAWLKRALDIGLAGVGLLLTIPLFFILGLAIFLDSPGYPFYSQERVGKGGKIFQIIKLRSMTPGAEREGRWTERGDTRVTRVGRFLRLTRLDELPQLINVLRGEMSLVGPRPERPEFVAQLRREIPFYDNRHSVQPGLTGWAQVKLGYAHPLRDALAKLEYDLYYIKRRSFGLDLIILLKTIGVVLTLEGW
ncbi:MAG TPA: hypothetical protein DCP08_02720 [Chloroflexi bacterium]|nr:hypothetical protein [Chloroflexota bacterium]